MNKTAINPYSVRNKMRKNRYILGAIVSKNFKSQYRNSVLGVVWTVLNPLLNMIVMALVFSEMFGSKAGVGNYPVYLFCGNLIFSIMRQATTQSLTSIVGNAGLIKKVRISYSVFPISNTCLSLVNFGMSFIALIGIMLFEKQQFHWTMVLTLTIIPAVLMFSLGIGLILASLYVFFRDIKHMYSVALTLWTYLTPLFYTASSLKNSAIAKIVELNPMTQYVTMFRDIIQWGNVPSWGTYLYVYAFALAMWGIGYLIYRLLRKKFILYI